ncbi:MAG TPA: ABC transporter permease [Elusimicrobia bacterium]|jgi:phospholipid/cholesterol/gamma-HCH transport system permease protein|nr:ABC transporter permease [Elusimicrobiota bacterium]
MLWEIINKITRTIDKRILSFFRYLSDLFLLLYLTGKIFFLAPLEGRRIVRKITLNQIIFTGIDALLIVSVIALSLGVIVILQAVPQLSKVGAVNLIGKILVLAIVREMSPLLTAFLVISRSGSAIATEIGTMRISNEIDVLEVMGINPFHLIIFPRIIGCIVAMFCLTLYFNFVSILGGFIVSAFLLKASLYTLFSSLISALSFKDIFICLLKSLSFGLIISLISCYHGLSVKISPTEIPQQTTRAIVNSIIFIIILNGTVTVLTYG